MTPLTHEDTEKDSVNLAEGEILDVRNLRISFGAMEVVQGVSLRLQRGQTLALVGESGSGKSVTALSLLRLLPQGASVDPGSSIVVSGQPVLSLTPRQLRQLRGGSVGMIFQEPMTSLNPLHTIEKQIGETLQLHRGVSGRALREQVLALLEEVGIDNAARRMGAFPHELSGGQRQRVMIAMALANDPALLIADEPTTALDVTVASQILELLKRLQHKRHMAILLITHNLGIVRRYAHQIAVMQTGRIVEQGTCTEIFTSPRHCCTRMLLDAERHHPPVPVVAGAPELLRVEDLRVWFPIKKGIWRRTVDHVRAVDGVSLRVARGETLGIVGESGSGKTTLGLALLRLLPASGEIHFDGHALHALKHKAMRPLRRAVQVVLQDPYGSLSPRMNVAQILEEGLLVHGFSVSERRELVQWALQEVGLDGAMLERYPHEFSGGQRQRIAIARALVLKPRLLVLDEPTSALDQSTQAQVMALLRQLQAKYGLTYLFISHDLGLIRSISHQVLVMKDGRAVEQGSTEAIFAEPRHPYTRQLMQSALTV